MRMMLSSCRPSETLGRLRTSMIRTERSRAEQSQSRARAEPEQSGADQNRIEHR